MTPGDQASQVRDQLLEIAKGHGEGVAVLTAHIHVGGAAAFLLRQVGARQALEIFAEITDVLQGAAADADITAGRALRLPSIIARGDAE